MKYASSILIAFFLVACSDSPTTMIGSDASTDASPHSDAALDAGRQDAQVTDSGADATVTDAGELDATTDATVTDAGELDSGELDAGEFDAGELDAGEVDAGEVDASTSDGGISAEVLEFVENFAATDMNFTTATCHCQYMLFEFPSEEACVAALVSAPPSECYQMQWTMHWEEIGPRMECIRAAHDAYYSCIAGGTCAEDHVMMCDDAHGASFFGCLDIASELSASIDEICGSL